MSNKAIDWAKAQTIKPSGAKFILVMLGDCADERFIAWPSSAYLERVTGQDRKTVLENLKRLRELGYIEDTGERKGDTKQVIVYRLKSPENGIVVRPVDNQEGCQATRLNDTENGTTKESQIRNSTENGTVPLFPENSTVFPIKQSQISPETVPKTGHGTIIEPSGNLKQTLSGLPDDMPSGFVQFWQAWPKSDRKQARAECLKKWMAKGLEKISTRIVQHVELCKQTKTWRDGYEPAPLTYINQKRWLDDDPDTGNNTDVPVWER